MIVWCTECEKEIQLGNRDNPETWNQIIILREDIPMSSLSKGIDHYFCSRKCCALYLIRNGRL